LTFLHILGIILKILGFTLLGALGLVLVILLVLLLIPIGADVEYIGGDFKLSAKVCGILIQLLPKKKKDEDKPPKEKKEKKKKEKKPKPEKEAGEEKPKEKKKLDFTVEEIFEVIQKVLGSLKKFGKLTVDRFLLHYTAGGKDPIRRRAPSARSTLRFARLSRSARTSSASRIMTCGQTAISRQTR